MFFFLPLAGFSQQSIGKSREDIRKELEKKAGGDKNAKSKIHNNASWISYTVVENGKTAEFSYDFDQNNKCVIETIKAADKSSYDYYLNAALADKEFEWKRINENQYISKFSAYRMLELAGESVPNQFSFFKTDWNKEMYELLSQSKRDK
jgi:hypothetical protein